MYSTVQQRLATESGVRELVNLRKFKVSHLDTYFHRMAATSITFFVLLTHFDANTFSTSREQELANASYPEHGRRERGEDETTEAKGSLSSGGGS